MRNRRVRKRDRVPSQIDSPCFLPTMRPDAWLLWRISRSPTDQRAPSWAQVGQQLHWPARVSIASRWLGVNLSELSEDSEKPGRSGSSSVDLTFQGLGMHWSRSGCQGGRQLISLFFLELLLSLMDLIPLLWPCSLKSPRTFQTNLRFRISSPGRSSWSWWGWLFRRVLTGEESQSSGW